MSKKPSKLAESAASYATKKPAKAAVGQEGRSTPASDAAFKRITDKIFTERKELLRKLAQ